MIDAKAKDNARSLYFSVGLLAAALISYVDERAARFVCVAILVFATALSEMTSLLLAISVVPWFTVFDFSSQSMTVIVSAAIICATVRLLPNVGELFGQLPRSHYGIVLASFTVLLATHVRDLSYESVRGVIFVAAMLLIFLAVRFRWAKDNSGAIARWMFGSIIASCLISFVFLYGPVEWLIVKYPRVDNLRLAGTFDEANGAGRYLLPIFMLMLVRTAQRFSVLNFILLAFVAICVAATTSKSTIFAVLFASILYLLLDTRWRRTSVAVSVGALAMAVWIFVVNPPLTQRTARAWQATGHSGAVGYFAKTPPAQSATDVLRKDLRVGTSTQMTKNETGKTVYTDREYSLWHTGQRDILWSAGAAVVRDNFLWGIGYRQWKDELMRRTNFPFISPHDGFLEVTGAYGVIGAALYLALVLWLVPRSFIRARRALATLSSGDVYLAWATLSATGLLIYELTDVCTSLAATLPAIWFWTLLGVQEARLEQDQSSAPITSPASE